MMAYTDNARKGDAMKRLLLLLMILLLSGSTLFAGTGSLLLDVVILGLDVGAKAGKGKVEVTLPVEEKEITVRRVSMKKMKTTFEEHNFLLLEYEKRLEIYDRLSVPITWPVVKGITIGFGKGSRLQRDHAGSITGIVMDSASAAAIGTGLVFIVIDAIFVAMLGGRENFREDELKTTGENLLFGGLIALGASRAIQGVGPAVYGLRYNKVLREGLGLKKDRSDAVEPSIGFAPLPTGDGRLQWQVAARIPLR